MTVVNVVRKEKELDVASLEHSLVNQQLSASSLNGADPWFSSIRLMQSFPIFKLISRSIIRCKYLYFLSLTLSSLTLFKLWLRLEDQAMASRRHFLRGEDSLRSRVSSPSGGALL